MSTRVPEYISSSSTIKHKDKKKRRNILGTNKADQRWMTVVLFYFRVICARVS